MLGASEIVKARVARRGLRRVDIEAFDHPRDEHRERFAWLQAGFSASRICPEIHVFSDDFPATLDLRCVRGLPVTVACEDRSRALQIAERAMEFEPLRVVIFGASAVWYPEPIGLQSWGMRA